MIIYDFYDFNAKNTVNTTAASGLTLWLTDILMRANICWYNALPASLLSHSRALPRTTDLWTIFHRKAFAKVLQKANSYLENLFAVYFWSFERSKGNQTPAHWLEYKCMDAVCGSEDSLGNSRNKMKPRAFDGCTNETKISTRNFFCVIYIHFCIIS